MSPPPPPTAGFDRFLVFLLLVLLPRLTRTFSIFQRLFFRGSELRNPHTLQDCGIYRDGQTVYLASSPQDEMGKPYSLEPFLGAGGLPRSLSRVLGQVRRKSGQCGRVKIKSDDLEKLERGDSARL